MAAIQILTDWTPAVVTDKQGNPVAGGEKTGIQYRVYATDDGRKFVQLNYCISTKVGQGPSSVYHATTPRGMVNIAGTYLSIRAGTVVKKLKKPETQRPVIASDAGDFPDA
jgi:hypothetical protein